MGDPRIWAEGRGRLGERSVGLRVGECSSVAILKGLALRSPPWEAQGQEGEGLCGGEYEIFVPRQLNPRKTECCL